MTYKSDNVKRKGPELYLNRLWCMGKKAIAWGCFVLATVTVHATVNDSAQAESKDKARAFDDSIRSVTSHILKTETSEIVYSATATSLTIYDRQSRPAGKIFYVAYKQEKLNGKERPLTFVFNGGPGAASAYLHLGALGPKRVVFDKGGVIAPPPARIADNPESWLTFTDLVFVDPIGTGYSRRAKQAGSNGRNSAKRSTESGSSGQSHSRQRVWGVEEDSDILSRFIRTYLTEESRWLSPVYLVGESYGGFRVARLSRQLQSGFGIAPSGVILISPVMDFGFLLGNDRSLWPWVSLLPSYAAAAAIHQQNGQLVDYQADNPRASLADVERFAMTEYLAGLAGGVNRPAWIEQAGNFAGLDRDILLRNHGRVRSGRFVKALLADRRRLLSLYDASITLLDPRPDVQSDVGRDFYLDQLNVPLISAMNHYIRENLNFKVAVPYLLLNKQVSRSWNWRSGIHGQQGFAEAVSDLKLAMSMNPDMQVLIMHGVFDLVTPFFASAIIINQMALDTQLVDNVKLRVYHGGHMPYLHKRSLEAMFKDAQRLYRR
ncbi:S10 family peptidase [Nitrosomonas marina]|uniref:Carboxypeptidase C (Cathepsin A) n=1 Tax=Nitrosomonas marina TaxID=917 RepID=A0A1H8EKA6_9PROT|nr:hypothetical protein [Nitrosomonas marina]SEN19915.1 Carboxypeptidase C (cathepsin A) [Nitrosomonas marina]